MKRKKMTFVDIFIYFICSLIAIIMIIPFYNVLIKSFATPLAVAKQPFYIIPTSFDLSAYEAIFSGKSMIRAFGISTFVTVAGTIVSMFISLCGAYVLSRKNLPGKKIIIFIIIITMFLNGGLIPYYLNIKSLQLINNLLVLILPNAVNTFYLIILINYFKGIPDSLEESARIDGASDFRILFSIMLPISKPTVAAISLFYAVDYWNDWWKALLFISDEEKYPMQLFLREMLMDVTRIANNSMAASMVTQFREILPDSLKMATVVVTMIPIMIVYPFLQKYFSAGAMIGSIKE